MADPWNKERSYREGERVRWCGDIFEARFDLCRNTNPTEPLGEKFWKRVSLVRPTKQAAHSDIGRR